MNDKEFPEQDEILLGTVGKIIGTSVFVKLEDFDKEGVISFSEVAPGRIRNIRDYVRTGQKAVVKVLRIDKTTGHIDLSLRRVSAKEKKEVLAIHKRRKDAAVLLSIVIKEKSRLEQLIKTIKQKITLSQLLIEAQELSAQPKKGITKLVQLGFNQEEASTFMRLIAEKARQKRVSVKAELFVSSEAEDGLQKIKTLFSVPNINIKYIGAPHYLITIKEKDYKEANKKLKELIDALAVKAKKLGCSFEVKKIH